MALTSGTGTGPATPDGTADGSAGAGPGPADRRGQRGPGGRPAVPPAPRVRRHNFLGSRRRQVVAAVVIAGAVAFLVTEGLRNATVYFKTADQAVADKSSLGSKQFRMEGTVQNDVRRSGPDTLFTVYANGVTVPVIESDQPTQLFRPDIPVVLEGHWQGAVFQSDQIMVKHSASYTEAHPDRLKSQLPRTGTTAP